MVSGLVSPDLERGFIIANLTLVTFGLLCWLGPVRRGRYTHGVATAPLLGVLAYRLAKRLLRAGP